MSSATTMTEHMSKAKALETNKHVGHSCQIPSSRVVSGSCQEIELLHFCPVSCTASMSKTTMYSASEPPSNDWANAVARKDWYFHKIIFWYRGYDAIIYGKIKSRNRVFYFPQLWWVKALTPNPSSLHVFWIVFMANGCELQKWMSFYLRNLSWHHDHTPWPKQKKSKENREQFPATSRIDRCMYTVLVPILFVIS